VVAEIFKIERWVESWLGSARAYVVAGICQSLCAGWQDENKATLSAHPSSLWDRIGFSSGPSVAKRQHKTMVVAFIRVNLYLSIRV
jgi:hypothetical protein